MGLFIFSAFSLFFILYIFFLFPSNKDRLKTKQHHIPLPTHSSLEYLSTTNSAFQNLTRENINSASNLTTPITQHNKRPYSSYQIKSTSVFNSDEGTKAINPHFAVQRERASKYEFREFCDSEGNISFGLKGNTFYSALFSSKSNEEIKKIQIVNRAQGETDGHSAYINRQTSIKYTKDCIGEKNHGKTARKQLFKPYNCTGTKPAQNHGNIYPNQYNYKAIEKSREGEGNAKQKIIEKYKNERKKDSKILYEEDRKSITNLEQLRKDNLYNISSSVNGCTDILNSTQEHEAMDVSSFLDNSSSNDESISTTHTNNLYDCTDREYTDDCGSEKSLSNSIMDNEGTGDKSSKRNSTPVENPPRENKDCSLNLNFLISVQKKLEMCPTSKDSSKKRKIDNKLTKKTVLDNFKKNQMFNCQKTGIKSKRKPRLPNKNMKNIGYTEKNAPARESKLFDGNGSTFSCFLEGSKPLNMKSGKDAGITCPPYINNNSSFASFRPIQDKKPLNNCDYFSNSQKDKICYEPLSDECSEEKIERDSESKNHSLDKNIGEKESDSMQANVIGEEKGSLSSGYPNYLALNGIPNNNDSFVLNSNDLEDENINEVIEF